ncbi:MAG: YeeE/YedE family protein [Bdellovibrionaceae bacterium]|nr:YeeE/YedE family protein [Pseudobdellovibrionaceae bacterium]
MEFSSPLTPLIGGSLIGLAVTIMLLFNGRVTGLSGIIAATLSRPNKDNVWRTMVVLGMLIGGLVMYKTSPELFLNSSDRGLITIVVAGLLVGYGTVMGSGCTSGHAICGLSRFSLRSLAATITFMFFGFLAVQIWQNFFGDRI